MREKENTERKFKVCLCCFSFFWWYVVLFVPLTWSTQFSNYNNYQKHQHSRKGNNLRPGKTNIIWYICKKKGHKAFHYKNRRQKDIYQTKRTYSRGQTYFFSLGYDIVSDKSNLLVDCGATENVISDKSKKKKKKLSKFWTREPFCWISWWDQSE